MQIQECESLHSRLGLPTRNDVETRTSHFPSISPLTRLTFSPHLARSAPPTAFRTHPVDVYSDQSPLFAWQIDLPNPYGTTEDVHASLSHQSSITVDTEAHFEDNYELKRRRPMTPLQLTEQLRLRGYGEPVMRTTSSSGPSSIYNAPQYGKSRILPKNPSKREKIKGRARLDYEMANMRALAFCEQQTSKVFRSASANMRDRDVQFVEDEMREKIHKDDDTTQDQTDGKATMAVDREELFRRVNTWIEEVECAWKEVT